MFLSRGDRDLGVASQTHLVSQALSRGEAKDSILLSSRDGYLLEPTKWPKGSQASCGTSPVSPELQVDSLPAEPSRLSMVDIFQSPSPSPPTPAPQAIPLAQINIC